MSQEIPARTHAEAGGQPPSNAQAGKLQSLLFLTAATNFSLRPANDLMRFRASAADTFSGEFDACDLRWFSFFKRFWFLPISFSPLQELRRPASQVRRFR